MSKTTAQLRRLWHEFECGEDAMVLIPFGPDKIRVAPPTTEAFEALAAVLHHHGYEIRTQDTDSYNCRTITGGAGKSLHSYGIAVDVNWQTNPFKDHQGTRQVRFSQEDTQALRARDVRFGRADTDMTAAMIDDVRKIRTRAGIPVFEWGGSWGGHKDCMHFELDVSPEELAAGLDRESIVGLAAYLATLEGHAPEPSTLTVMPTVSPLSTSTERFEVIARDGLRLRTGPSTGHDIKRVLPAGTQLFVMNRSEGWALVDLLGDGLADGFVSAAFLRAQDGVSPVAIAAAPAIVPVETGRADITGNVTTELVARMFPSTPKANIVTHLPDVLAGLHAGGLGDRDMVLMALATIRAETEGFRPISEGRSGFNTRTHPFDLYDPGTRVGSNLGNTEPGDGARFKGRGFVQLTGRDNYRRIGGQIGTDLIGNPELANDSRVAGRILAQFLRNCQPRLRAALAANDLVKARRCVNGGTHGMSRFRDAWERGEAAIPG